MKITLRQLFLLVALVAVCCGWWVERRELKAKTDELEGIERIITPIPNTNAYGVEQQRLRQAKLDEIMKLPQLSLRDLFWLVLVAAILCGWWVEQSNRGPATGATYFAPGSGSADGNFIPASVLLKDDYRGKP